MSRSKYTYEDLAPIVARSRSVPDEEVFVERCPIVITGTRLAARLRRLGRPCCCEVCGVNEWRGAPLTLHLDHVNGVHTDNRLENLRFLCPNCHQQTVTWGNPGKRRRPDADSDVARERAPTCGRWRAPDADYRTWSIALTKSR